MKIEDTFNNFLKLYIKKMWANIKNISSLSTIERIVFLFISILIAIYLLYHNAGFLFFIILLPWYLHLKTFLQVIKSKLITWKYRKLSKIFDNKVQVVEESGTTLKLSSFITIEEIQKKKSELELFFNREISSIERQGRLFRCIDINFKEDEERIEIKKIYKLIDYIKTASIKGKTVPMLFGVDEKGKIIVEDLKKLKNILISGEIGGGKSTLLHVFIQSLMWYNDLAFCLVDFKRVGLSPYKYFNNCNFVKNIKEFFNLIEKLNEEMENRYDLFESFECDNIDHYNTINGNKISRIVIIIDEIASIRMGQNSDKMEEILTNISYLGRAAGIHIIGATQRPSGVRLSTEIRDSLISKISFRVFSPRTQEMTGVKNTENLKTGEFMTAHIPGRTGIFKGFYVDKRESNETYEELKKNKYYKND